MLLPYIEVDCLNKIEDLDEHCLNLLTEVH